MLSSSSHSLQNPSQLRLTHSAFFGKDVDVLVGVTVVSRVDVGPSVMGGRVMVLGGVVGLALVSFSSQQPHHLPGVSQELVAAGVVVVKSEVMVTSSLVVVLSLHPNQPGVLHVDVDVDCVVGVVVPVAGPVFVVLSKQPHHPGVWQVDVRVLVRVVVGTVDVVVLSVPLLSYIFHWAQSRHSGVNEHTGTSSYFMMTSDITARILCVPIPTRQPLSATTSYTHSLPVWHAVSSAYPAKEQDAVAPLQVPMKIGSAVCPK